MQPAALLAAFVLLVALPATGAQDPQAYFDSRLNFPTDFGQPSCIQWEPTSRSLYLVGSTSFYANGQLASQGIPRAEYYGVQVMRVILDDFGNTVSTDLSGRLFDGIAGACLLGEGPSAGYMFIGVDGGVVFSVRLSDWSYVTDIQLGAAGDPSAFVSGMTWFDDGNFTQFYALLSNPPVLFLLSNTLAILQESRSVFFNLTPYATRTTLPVVHDAARGKVFFPTFSLGNPSPFGNSDVNIVAFEDSLTQDSWQFIPLGLLGESDTIGDVWDYRPSAIFNPANDQFSYWGISNYVVAIDHSDMSLVSPNISVPYITSLNYVPGDPTKAWAISSSGADTSIQVVDLIGGANAALNISTVLDIPAASSPPCAGWTWAALFLPATPSANELYTFVAWNPGNTGTSFLCVLQNTTSPDTFDVLPITTSTTNNVFGIGAIIFDPNTFRFYTCGLNFLTEWQFPLAGGNQLERTSRPAIQFSGYCWEVIQTDDNTLVFHDSNNVFTVRLDTWESYTHNVMQFANPGSAISWITYDPAKNRVYVAASESRMFVVDLSSPFVTNLSPLPGINLPPSFINSQIILLDPGNQAIYLGNCAYVSGGNATLVEVNTATTPLQVTRFIAADKALQGEYCFATASWIDYNTHRTFWVDANLLNPTLGLYENPGLRANGTSTQPGSSYGAAIDRSGRQTYILGRDTVSALSLPRSVLWRRCWDDDTLGNARVSTNQPTWLRVFDTLDGQFSSRFNVSYFLAWDYIAQPSILRYSTPLTCPLVNIVPPPPSTLPPVINPTPFPDPTPTPPPLPTGATTATTGRPTPPPTIVDGGKKGLSGGAIAGIVIFAIIFTGAAAALIYYLITHRAAAAGGASAGSSVTVGNAASGGGAIQGASSGDRDGHQRFHDEDSGRF